MLELRLSHILVARLSKLHEGDSYEAWQIPHPRRFARLIALKVAYR